MTPWWEQWRQAYHRQLCQHVVRVDAQGVPNTADRGNRTSRTIAQHMWQHIARQAGCTLEEGFLAAQKVGRRFEQATYEALQQAFLALEHLCPGPWRFYLNHRIEEFVQYAHLTELSRALKDTPQLHAALGDYLIAPDILIARLPLDDAAINQRAFLVEASMPTARWTPLRAVNNQKPILHASVSCKWTIRSDRSQNVRTEGLNLIRNRKGHAPHIVVVTAEPHPGRLASLALGTGDLDCVYHVALPELQAAVHALDEGTAQDLLATLVAGQRLRDISDLPFDLAA